MEKFHFIFQVSKYRVYKYKKKNSQVQKYQIIKAFREVFARAGL